MRKLILHMRCNILFDGYDFLGRVLDLSNSTPIFWIVSRRWLLLFNKNFICAFRPQNYYYLWTYKFYLNLWMVYYSSDPAVIIFDDLAKDNYEMIYTPLNFDDIQMVIEKLAKFHALSLVLKEQGHDIQQYGNPYKVAQYQQVFANYTNALPSIAAEIRKWPGFDKIAEALADSKERILEKFFRVFEERDWGYNVLCHNDFHLRNMMFKRTNDEAPLIDMVFLDFQCPFYGSPAPDLAAMLANMGDQTVRDRRLEVYRSYYDLFVKALKLYGYKGVPPSLVDLHTEILKQGGVEVFYTLFSLPLFNADMTKLDSEMIIADEGKGVIGFLAAIYRQPEVIEMMKKLLPRLYYKGLLD